jgi:hypothetical protein
VPAIETAASRIPAGSGVDRAGPVILLHPLGGTAPQAPQYLLAADGGRKTRYETVQRYANVEADMVARMVRDNTTRELTLYLVADCPGGYSDKIIEVDGIEDRFVPDDEGRVRLHGIDETRLGRKGLRLRSPVASFDLEPYSGLKDRIALEGRFEIPGAEFDLIQIELEEESGKTLYKVRIQQLRDRPDFQDVHVVVTQRGAAAKNSRAHRGVAVFEDLDLEKALKIRIY